MKTYACAITVALALLMPLSAVATPDFMKQNIGSLDCGINEIAKFNGVAWECSADLDALSQAIEEVGDLGCSATQQDNSVLIQCGDGTAGVIAGAGTVVIYPEGQIGQVPPIDYNTGPIVAMDATGVVLGEVSSIYQGNDIIRIVLFRDPVQTHLEVLAKLINLHGTQEILFSFERNNLFFLSEDCSGAAFIDPYSNYGAAELNGQFFVGDPSTVERILFKSHIYSGTWGEMWDDSIGWHIGRIEASECVREDVVSEASLATQYFPAPEIANAVYPVRVEQLP